MPKYNPDTSHWDADDEDEPEPDPAVRVGNHSLWINDERDAIERYDGLQWWFVIEDGLITGIDLSHYCPGPSHTDPIGWRAWEDVPEPVQNVVLWELNAEEASEVVDFDACREVAD